MAQKKLYTEADIELAEDHAYFAGGESMREKVITLLQSYISVLSEKIQPVVITKKNFEMLIERISKIS